MKNPVTKIKILRAIPCGAISKNLIVDSIHEVVEPPKEYKKKLPNGDGGYWVMGIGEPVRVLNHECETIE